MDCRFTDSSCRGRVVEWRIWKVGDLESVDIAVCSEHGRELVKLYRLGDPESLPTRPRQSLKPTKLRATKETAHLKKHPK